MVSIGGLNGQSIGRTVLVTPSGKFSPQGSRLARRMAIDIAGFVTDLKDHAIEHGFHVHDERHYMETYSLRQSWEVDVHPEDACGGPLDLHLSLDVEPRTLLSMQDRIDEMGDDWEEPEDLYRLNLFFNWSILPKLSTPPDLLVLGTDLAGVGGVDLPIEVTAIDTIASITDAPERSLQVVGKCQVSLVDVFMAREQLCEELDRAKAVSEYLLERVTGWLELPG